MSKLYSNEIVFRGHPDKVCDQISGAILRALIEKDVHTRAGIECAIKNNILWIFGEVTTDAVVDYAEIAKRVMTDIGYDASDLIVQISLSKQSHDIALGTNDRVKGAGDNGMMFGYACNDTEELLPVAQVILQKFAKEYDELCHVLPDQFLPDGKAQITGEYDDDGRLVKIETFTICYQNTETNRMINDGFLLKKAERIASDYGISIEKFLINPTGEFKIGGPWADAGLTGRKIVVDAYQSFANVGGGCMNGKDPTKVDFSAAHKAREIAKKFLDGFHLDWCEVQLSYAIGRAEPLAIYIRSNKGDIPVPQALYEECTPARIIDDLHLLDADFEELAKFGHFTR